jgi:hypothetical protein
MIKIIFSWENISMIKFVIFYPYNHGILVVDLNWSLGHKYKWVHATINSSSDVSKKKKTHPR